MKKTLLTLICIFSISSQSSYSQDLPKMRGSFGFGYFIPSKESFRMNYDQSLFVSTVGVPLSLELGVQYFLSEEHSLQFQALDINHKLTSDKSVTLTIFPFRLQYIYYPSKTVVDFGKWVPFIGGGAGFYWVRSGADIFETNPNGPEFNNILKLSSNYFGYGMNLLGGMEARVSSSNAFDFGVTYDLTHVGSVDDGGLGNVGGFHFNVQFLFGL